MKFVIKRSKKNGKFFFHLQSGNNKIIAPSQQYKRKAYAVRTIRRMQIAVFTAIVIDTTKKGGAK
jgi:uncharacterized protein YegP (UPF0339 family)